MNEKQFEFLLYKHEKIIRLYYFTRLKFTIVKRVNLSNIIFIVKNQHIKIEI